MKSRAAELDRCTACGGPMRGPGSLHSSCATDLDRAQRSADAPPLHFARGSVRIPPAHTLDPPAPVPLRVLVDTREQAPLTSSFPPLIGRDRRPVIAKEATLTAGDYTTEPLLGLAVVERKSPSDYVGTLTHGRDRWEREVERLQGLELACVIVEGSFDECCALTGTRWESLVGSNMALDVKRRIPVHFVGSRLAAAWAVCSWLRRAEMALLGRPSPIERLVSAAKGLGL